MCSNPLVDFQRTLKTVYTKLGICTMYMYIYNCTLYKLVTCTCTIQKILYVHCIHVQVYTKRTYFSFVKRYMYNVHVYMYAYLQDHAER